MPLTNVLDWIPSSFRQEIRDALVDFVYDRAGDLLGDQVAEKIKGLRSDAAFNRSFETALLKGAQCFVQSSDDPVTVAVIAADSGFSTPEVRSALITVLKKPGAYLAEEWEALVRSFSNTLKAPMERERLECALRQLLKCLAQELWHLPELQPAYSLQFQRATAEAVGVQVELHKQHLTAIKGLGSDIREALLQMTDAIAERRLLLDGERAMPVRSDRVMYHNLPQSEYGQFIGRDEELAQVMRILRPYPDSQHALVTIDGIGGIGKSALALEVAYRYLYSTDALPPQEHFEAIVWTSAKESVLTARGVVARPHPSRTLDDILGTIAVTLQRESIVHAPLEEQPQLVRDYLTRQRTLLIVDNLEAVDDEAVMAFLRELPAPTKAIVTTRHRVDVAYPVRLVGMPWEDAQSLIRLECDKKGVLLAEADIRRLYDRTGGVPLGIVWSVAQMGFGYGVDQVLSRLGEPTSDIARFCFEASLRLIRDKPAHKLLMTLALFASDATRHALGSVADLPDLDRDEGLVELEYLSLINKSGNRFRLLPLTKIFAAAELANHPESEKTLILRVIRYLRRLSKGTESEYYWRHGDYEFYQEGHNILEAIQLARQHGTAQDVFDLTLAAVDYLDHDGRWSSIVETIEPALRLASSINNYEAIASLASAEGWFLMHSGAYDKAREKFLEALKRYRQARNEEGESIVLHRLSGIYRKEANFEEAEHLCDQAWELAERLGKGDLKALIHLAYGKLERDRKSWEAARDYFMRVSKWFEDRAEQTPRDEALARSTWGHLAVVALQQGKPEEAKELCLKSLEFFEHFGTKSYLATLKYRLALAEEALGADESARQHAEEAFHWFERLGMDPDRDMAQALLDRLAQ